MTQPTKQPFNWPALLVGILALFAFILSYASLRDLALANGVGPWLSYLWPLLLDFAMIVTSTAILRASQRGERVYYAWILTASFAALATFGNILDVTRLGIPPVVIAAGVKALAPVALFLAFELLMSMIRADAQRDKAGQSLASLLAHSKTAAASLTELQAQTEAAEAHLAELQRAADRANEAALRQAQDAGQQVAELEARAEALRAEVDRLEGQRATLIQEAKETGPKVDHPAPADEGQLTDRLALILDLAQAGKGPTAISKETGIPLTTVKRGLKELNGRVKT